MKFLFILILCYKFTYFDFKVSDCDFVINVNYMYSKKMFKLKERMFRMNLVIIIFLFCSFVFSLNFDDEGNTQLNVYLIITLFLIKSSAHFFFFEAGRFSFLLQLQFYFILLNDNG